MTENNFTLNEGDVYVLFFQDGPADGQIEMRVSHDGSYAQRVTVYATVDGLETGLTYVAESAKSVAGQVQVFYAWDQPSSDDIEDLDDRGEH